MVWLGSSSPCSFYNRRSLRIMTQIGMNEYLNSLNRIDSLYSALIHAGYKVKRFKLFLRVISLPLLPILKVFNISPEIICVVKKK